MAEQDTIESLQDRANQIVDEDLETTRRMANLVMEDRDLNTKTLENLNQQGEQIRKVEGNLNRINADTKKAEKDLSQMEKCCGLCTCPWRRNSDFENSGNYQQTWKNSDSDEVISEQPGASSGRNAGRGGGNRGQQGGQYIEKVLENDAREDEMNENLGVVHNVLGDLRQQALSMGEELDEQNESLGRIQAKMESDTKRVEAASRRTNALLGK